jgi:ribosomal protein S19
LVDNLNLKKQNVYGLELRDKFVEICRADLISRVLNKSNNNLMLLRTHRILKENIGKTYYVYNGMKRIPLFIKKNMVGFKIGEFILSKKVRNMNYKLNSSKAFQRIRSKKKTKRSRRKKQKNFIISLKNNLVKLKKTIRSNKSNNNIKQLKKQIFSEYKLHISGIFVQI